jgi:hypothetical protein
MSRRSFPRIDPAALRHHADEVRVERVWQRVEHDLLAGRQDGKDGRRSRSPVMYLAVAAAFGAFVAGLLVGKTTWDRRGVAPASAVMPAPDQEKALVEVLAAGTQQRIFPLQGGGSLTLSPGATVEVVRAGSAVTLALLQGEASVLSASRPLTIAAGEARINTQAGSVVSVRRNADDADVKVDEGSVSVTSPEGRAELGKSEHKAVPLHAAVAVVRSFAKPLHDHPLPKAKPLKALAAVAKVAGPEWLTRHFNGDDEGALAILEKQDIQEVIRSAKNAVELDAIAELMRGKGQNQAAAINALGRIIEAFPDDQHAFLAAKTLERMYLTKDSAKAEEYRALAGKLAPKKGPAADSIDCNDYKDRIRAEPDKSKAAQLAKEYLDKHPDGACHVEFEQMAQSAPAPAPAASGDTPQLSAPAASAPPAPPTL